MKQLAKSLILKAADALKELGDSILHVSETAWLAGQNNMAASSGALPKKLRKTNET